jgi:large subunit ribosomal protein L17
MRHRKVTKKLGRNTSHRRALLRNLVTSLIMEERIETTTAKAKAMRPHVEKMITLGKRGDLAARRLALGYLMTRESVERLFDTVAPRFGDRNGGYLRIIHKGWRSGDGADTVYIELLGSEKIIEAKRKKRADVRSKRQEKIRQQMEEDQKSAAGEPEPEDDKKKK